MKITARTALFGICAGTVLHAHAFVYSEPLAFSAPARGIGPIGDSDQVGLGPITFRYDVGAGSATVGGEFNGVMSVDYSRFMRGPGTTSLGLSFLGDPSGGQLKSDLGGSVKVSASAFGASINLLNRNFALNVAKSYAPALGGTVTGTDSFGVIGANINVGVAQASANFDITQTDTFKATGIDGILAYRLRGSRPYQLMSFSMTSDGGLNLDVDLAQTGIWDFRLVKMKLINTFSTSFDAEVTLRERNLGCGPLGLSWCAWNSLTVADVDLYDTQPFALNFNSVSGGDRFSIWVGSQPASIPAVPEPATLPLLAAGSAFLWGVRRYAQRAATRHGRVRGIDSGWRRPTPA